MRQLLGDTALPGPRARAQELLSRTRFQLRRPQRDALSRRRWACKDPADYFDFALDAFPGGPSQNRDELLDLIAYASPRHPEVVVELGTEAGGTIFVLTQAIPTVSTAVGVDLLVHNRARLHAFKRPDQALHLVNGDSQDTRTLRLVRTLLAGLPIDLLLIDADHTFAGAWRDFVAYAQLVRDGGLVVFHDIVPDSRLRGLPPTASYVGEVPVLWQLLKRHFPHREFVDSWEQDGRGVGALELDASVPPTLQMLAPDHVAAGHPTATRSPS